MARELTDKQKLWVERIKEQRRIGLTKKEFCKRNNLNMHQFDYYHRFLKETSTFPENSAFISLKSSEINQPIVLHLPSGIRIEIPNAHINKLASIASQF